MNGVIARLVLRALPQPGGVRPRPASRFDREASPPAPSPGPAEPEAGRRNERSADGPERNRPDATLPDDTAGTARSPATFSDLRHRSDVRPIEQSVTAAVPAPGFPPLVTEALSVRPTLQEPSNDALTSRDIGDGPHGDTLLPQPVPGPAAPRPAAPHENRFIAEGRHFPLLPPVVPAFEPPATLAGPPPIGSRRDVAPQPPDIRISIGQIDLRAARPERRPQPVRASPPALMSLEDYLAKGRTRR